MADFPRWVDREGVDSYAMYSAYLHYQFHTKKTHFNDVAGWQPVWWGHLHMILHRVERVPGIVVRPDTQGVKCRDCDRRPCSRCDAGVGGYQLRWYSVY